MTALDDAARRLAEGAAHPPYLYAMGPDDARLALGLMQAPPDVPDGLEHRTALVDDVPVHLVIPAGVVDAPVVLYVHGGGWVLGGWSTHHRLATALAREVGAVVVMPEYSRVPEARYPVAVTQLTAVLAAIRAGVLPIPADPRRIALAGDCAGATLALTLALRDRELVAQALLYPMGRPLPDDPSAIEFATGAALRLADVRRLCHEYAPLGEPGADPLQAETGLAGLPPTLLITAEADVTRDRAEHFGRRLRTAGVPVTATRYLGTVHDFVVLDALRWTSAARSAITQVTDFLRAAFGATGTGCR
ncbi:alpha/beta hydrolase [Actinoplanes sp. HUAS TT8]|uniref:alpha/beta hydrolase n=1 Tax=Actinoplanes sp. HUAS TT8 TaxID=3447453 RepID=UPI003F51C2C7